MPNIFLYRIGQIFVDIFAKNMKGWSGKSKILCIEQSGRAEKDTRKQKFCLSSPPQCKFFPNFFLSPWYLKIFDAVFFQYSVQLVPSLYHVLQQAFKNWNWFFYRWDGVSTRTQIFESKWNCQNMFTQIFLSEIIWKAESGGQGTDFLISQIPKGLTHCAMIISTKMLIYWDPHV